MAYDAVMVRSRAVLLVAIVVAVGLGSSAGRWLQRTTVVPVSARVVEVVDGDTVVATLSDRGVDEVVRLLGVDTPETKHPDRPVECFGPEAEAFTRERFLGSEVELVFDVEHRDVYGRLLAYVAMDGARFKALRD